MDHTAFFKKRPNGNADADKLLPRGISVKVISHSDSYVKVELDSGEVGYVPSVMLEDPNAAPSNSQTNRPDESQVYPPLNGTNGALPSTLPTGEPPNGAIPTVIDPDAPASNAPFAAPSTPKTTPAPLPPNGKE